VRFIKWRRLGWLKHVITMDQRVVKNISESKPEGRRKVRSSRIELIKDVENDLRDLRLKRWIPEANREE
jgi:hypothetical protein